MPASADFRLRLARAVARDDVGFVLHADNSAGSRASLSDLVDTGGAFVVVPHPRLFVVDCDVDGVASHVAARRRAAFDTLVAAARAHGVPLVVVASGRPGNRHAYLVTGVADRTERAALVAACRNAGLDVRDSGIRPPLAAHRAGYPVTLVSSTDPTVALETLQATPPSGVVPALAAALGTGRLSLRMRRLLRTGHTSAGLPSASEGRMAVAVAVRGAGLPVTYLAALFDDPQHQLTDSYRQRSARWRRRELARLWEKAGIWVATHPARVDDVEERARAVATWRAALRGVAWAGVGGASALAVAEALGRLATRLGRLEVGAALDDVAVAAGLSRDATRSALRRLAGWRWLSVAAEATPTTARMYALTLPDTLDADQVAAAAAAGDTTLLDGDGFADLGADVARWSGGVGKSATRVARQLGCGPADVPALATALHMSPNAVRIHLRRLARLGVVVRDGRRWTRTGLAAGRLAEVLGVAGARARHVAAVAARRAQRSQIRATWRRAVGTIRSALTRGEATGWAQATSVLPPRVLGAQLRRAQRSGPLPDWAQAATA